jgi:hypothetical protein
MAIEHQNISIGEATAALAAETAQTAWKNALVGHASRKWTLEEEFDAGAAVHWVVVKNDAADVFYVCIGRVIADGTMCCFVGEEYTAAANLLAKFAPRCDNTGYILANNFFGTNSSDVATFTLSSSLPNTNGQPQTASIPAAATERLFTCVDSDYAVLNVNNVNMYVSCDRRPHRPEDRSRGPPAIGCGQLENGSQGRFFAITRHPIAASDAPVNVSGAHNMVPVVGGSYIDMTMIHNQAMLTGIYGFPDRYQGDRVAASECVAIMQAASEMGYNIPGLSTGQDGALRGSSRAFA